MIFLERNVAMRVLIIYLMLLFSLSVFSVKPQQIIDSMVIKVAPWDAVTDIGIECSNFETSIDYPIKSNVSKNKTGAKANDSILVDKEWTERRTIFYSEEEMDSIGEGSIIEDGGIIAKYLSDSLVVYVNKAGEEIRIVPNMVCFDKGREGLIKELFSSLDISNEDYGGRVIFFILFNNMLQVQEIRVFEPLRPSYKANDLVIDKYVKYLEQTEGRWIRKENKQEWNLYIFSTVI